jgi:hypothetical protein
LYSFRLIKEYSSTDNREAKYLGYFNFMIAQQDVCSLRAVGGSWMPDVS